MIPGLTVLFSVFGTTFDTLHVSLCVGRPFVKVRSPLSVPPVGPSLSLVPGPHPPPLRDAYPSPRRSRLRPYPSPRNPRYFLLNFGTFLALPTNVPPPGGVVLGPCTFPPHRTPYLIKRLRLLSSFRIRPKIVVSDRGRRPLSGSPRGTSL